MKLIEPMSYVPPEETVPDPTTEVSTVKRIGVNSASRERSWLGTVKSTLARSGFMNWVSPVHLKTYIQNLGLA